MQVPVIFLKEGTETTKGAGHVTSNIKACRAVSNAVRTTLGPCGMDKMIVDNKGKSTISNDGATIMKLLNVTHPSAKCLVDIAKSQDAEVGDGTTSIVLLAAEFLHCANEFVSQGVHPMLIAKAFNKAKDLAMDELANISIHHYKSSTGKEQRNILVKCAETCLSSKLLCNQRTFFGNMVVDAVAVLDESMKMNMVGIKKVSGGGLEDSLLVNGVAFKKTFSYAGFEMQSKKYDNAKIAMLNIELELKSERENAEVRVETVKEYQNIVDAEWQILYDKMKICVDADVNVVLSKLPIGDVATQYFADRNMFCAGRVAEEDMNRVVAACGGSILTSISKGISKEQMGHCGIFEEKAVGSERFNFFTNCHKCETSTIIIRGGSDQFIAESERSLHDAIMVVRRMKVHKAIVAGGGATEMHISSHIKDIANKYEGKAQLMMLAWARALEVIPRQLSINAGMDPNNILNKLRYWHNKSNNEGKYYGVDIENNTVSNNYESFIWEPALVKRNVICAATEAACMILSVDQTIKHPKSGQ